MRNIIIVDMQKGFINENNMHIVEKINNYLKQNDFDNIFFTKCINNSDSPYTKILKWNGITKKEEQEIICDVSKKANILTKNCYGLSNKNFKCFRDLGITEMEICGTDTDACCLAIAFNLFDNNIKPIILSDLCASSSKKQNIHNNALEIMKRQFGYNNIK
ncbi:MAG: isochorismatase family cysteine hydrolase [Clostridia bacterium]